MHVYVCVCIYVYVYMYVCISLRAHGCIAASVLFGVYACRYICVMCVCMCVYIYIYMCVCVCVYVYVYVYMGLQLCEYHGAVSELFILHAGVVTFRNPFEVVKDRIMKEL